MALESTSAELKWWKLKIIIMLAGFLGVIPHQSVTLLLKIHMLPNPMLLVQNGVNLRYDSYSFYNFTHLIHLCQAVKKNPIHYFYEKVDQGGDGAVGNTSDKHFKCYHGNHKVITLMKSMKYNLTSWIIMF